MNEQLTLESVGVTMCMTTNGWMWLHDNLPRRHTDKSFYYRLLVVFNSFLIVAGIFVTISGTWSAVMDIRSSYKTGSITSPFSCADNSNSS